MFAGVFEVHLHAGMAALPLVREHHPLAELGMLDPLTESEIPVIGASLDIAPPLLPAAEHRS